jgi:phage minor structural protein
MYKIYADDTVLLYDSTLEDYHIGKGAVSLEAGKAGSFEFSVFPDHFYYDSFVELRTVITVYKDNRIVFRGRVLNAKTDYWRNLVLTCEGELAFLQDSVIRPYTFKGTAAALLEQLITQHNEQVDDFKRFKVGEATVAGGSIVRSNSDYTDTSSNLTSRLLEDSTGGCFLITHGEDGRDVIPTINYLKDYTKTATQVIEFGANLKDYVKSVSSEEVATAIIPLGAVIDDGNNETEDVPLTILGAKLADGTAYNKDYVFSETGVAFRGWIFKPVSFNDITTKEALKKKAEEYVETAINPNITIELTAIDLHLLDRSVESFNVCDWVKVFSVPHRLNATMLCKKQTLDLLNPGNDTITLGHTYATFTESSSRLTSSLSTVVSLSRLSGKLGVLNMLAGATEENSAKIVEIISRLDALTGGGTEEPTT